MEDKVEGTLITLTDDCLRAVCLHMDVLADIISFSKVSRQFRQAALYGLCHMSLTLVIENISCICGMENFMETRVFTYVLQDMANTSFTVLKPFAMQQNTALVQGVRRIKISLRTCEHVSLCDGCDGCVFCDGCVKGPCVSASAGQLTEIFELCEPFFSNLLSLQISSRCNGFDDSDLECICNAVCAMPKLVDVGLNGGLKGDLYGNCFIKLTEKLQSRNTSSVFSAFKTPKQSIQEPLTVAMLAQASLKEQQQMLGERLFPLISAIYPDLARRITGMLLEMENSEILRMLESHEALRAKVDEAVDVIRTYRPTTCRWQL